MSPPLRSNKRMADSFSPVSSMVPTTLKSFSLVLTASTGPNVIERNFVASIQDQSGKQKWSESGDIEPYVEPAVYEGLLSLVTQLYLKAADEMIP